MPARNAQHLAHASNAPAGRLAESNLAAPAPKKKAKGRVRFGMRRAFRRTLAIAMLSGFATFVGLSYLSVWGSVTSEMFRRGRLEDQLRVERLNLKGMENQANREMSDGAIGARATAEGMVKPREDDKIEIR